MKRKKFSKLIKFLSLIILAATLSYGFKGDTRGGGNTVNNSSHHYLSKTNASGKQGDSYALYVNNVYMPMNNAGNIGQANIPPLGTLVQFAGHGVIYSAGFFLSGKRNGQLFANAVAPSSLVEDYVPGTVQYGRADSRNVMYVLNSQDPPFGQSWQDWKDAVALGADFYDGDGDGQYNPIDKNGNGKWDPDEDAPDLLGDETVWCVYNDGLAQGQRRWNTVSPLGIEVRQTVFAFASAGALGNIIFLRYRFKYVGLSSSDPDELTDCYFGVWADPDIGNVSGFNNDLVGCDTLLNAGFDYHQIPAPEFGNQTPCDLIDFFSGPASYIPGVTFTDNNGNGIYDAGDIPLDTAYSVRGTKKGIIAIPGAKNLGLSSFVNYQNGDPLLNDPSTAIEARNYMLGLNRTGGTLDPCTWAYGTVIGVNCADVDNKFWYSGDPVAQNGWIDQTATDQRMMQNTGPFVLKKGVEKEIIVAYIIGQGTSPISSVTQAKTIDRGAQFIFDHNFVAPSPPPPVNPTVSTGEDFIDLSWQTAPQVGFSNNTSAYNLHFQGYNIYAYKTNSTAETVDNISNRVLVARYSANNFIHDLYSQNLGTGAIELLYARDTLKLLDTTLYSDPVNGRLRIRLTQDPFTGGPLIKGKPYYFSITSYAPNYQALIYKDNPSDSVGTPGDYYIDATSFTGLVENIAKITTVTMGSNIYDPPLPVAPANQIAGFASGQVGYDIVDQSKLTGDTYDVTFEEDSNSTFYSTFWKLTNVTTNQVLIPQSNQYTYGSDVVAGVLTDGFIPRVQDSPPSIGLDNITYTPANHVWYKTFSTTDGTGIYYVGKDLLQGSPIILTNNNTAKSDAIHATDLRKVELRFGTSGKAYRYLNGFIKTSPIPTTKKNTYVYAEGVTAADTVGSGSVGKFGQGFVDVPFTAWIVDDRFNEEKQLAVGIIEMSKDYGGHPDGIWDPTDSLLATSEVIVIFNSDYDPTGSQMVYTGGDFGGTTVWADLIRGYDIPANAPGITAEQRAIAKSKWFNAMYVVGLERETPTSFYQNGDILVIPMDTYPYTSNDVYRFSTRVGDQLSEADQKALFQKVNVFPNPLFGFNSGTSYTNSPADEPFVTFSNLPTDVTITIYSLSGNKLRTLTTADKSDPTSPFLRWNLENQSGLRVASGVYLAIVNSPKFGQKILKFSIIMPQKQLQRY